MSYEKTRYVTGIGDYEDYDAIRDAKEKFYRSPEKYTTERSYRSSRNSEYSRRQANERVQVVVEHWAGCTGERLTNDIRFALEDYYPDVKFKDFYGREHSYEVFVNGKLLYSRIMHGGYPYVDEVLDAVWRAKRGKEIYQIERYGGSDFCNIL
ncbi:migration and invasion enhancer 1-like [Mercenaria mercenaria]|uniref:migration and invasion enhancer 1-like n=1 Tax=Mercenaria mercenaria TaxID=6596 RepID=UPI00234F61F5|nr:migration and invasion enhancer 1-like [Mercenaria mercenaria]